MAYDPAALNLLSSLVPPAASPVYGIRSWDEVFRALDLRLPPDYIAFIERYGDCEFARWLRVFDFRTLTDEQFAHIPEWMDDYRDLREDSPEEFRLAMWPEPGGFFEWGCTIDGDIMGWMTVGKPEEWPIMIVARHHDEDSPVQETMTEWLVGWASGARFGSWAFSAESEEHPLICEAPD
ncbi:SMI1/KNR4 family protein [Nonomuraea insulae]|uniref:SMI1/KNR4 family protein n=1 Tax=Nonomuraea insulae TaxID=1616787 RepID=A0ABW1D2K3_9ACTN